MVKKLEDKTNYRRHTQQSRDWFRRYARKNLRNMRIPKLMREGKFVSTPKIGEMYLYYYDPKHKATLPHYDTFPLTIVFNILDDGWMGLNLHYLPPVLRVKLFTALLKLRNEKRYRPSTKLKITWQLLSTMAEHPLVQPCVKRYLANHTRSKLIKVDPSAWEIVLTLPVERFEKQSAAQVWKQTRTTRRKKR